MSVDAKRSAQRRRDLSRRQFLQTAGLIGAGVLAGGLLGCNSKPTATAPAAGPTVVTPKKTTIRYWTFLDPKDSNPRSQAQTEIISKFMAKNPNIEVQVELAPWQTIDKQLIQATAAGQGPDVAKIGEPVLATVVAAGALVPLDPFVTRWSAATKKDFIFDYNATVFGGKKMAFFNDHRILGLLFYRQDWLKAKKLSAPRTWDELLEAAKAIKTDNIAGFAVGLSKKGQAAELRNYLFPALWGRGGDMLNADGTAAFHSAAGVQAFQFLQECQVAGVFPAGLADVDLDKTLDMMKSSTLGMNLHGTHRLKSAQTGQGVGANLVTAPVPGVAVGKPSPVQPSGQTLAISKDSKNPEAAWEFLEYMISPEAEEINARVGGEAPTRASTYEAAWFKTPEAAEMMAWKDAIINGAKVFQYPEKFAQLMDILAEAGQAIVLNKAEVKKTLDAAALKWNTVIGKA